MKYKMKSTRRKIAVEVVETVFISAIFAMNARINTIKTVGVEILKNSSSVFACARAK
jgi:hypothetical protein